MTDDLLESAPPRTDDPLPPQEADVFVMPCSISQRRFWLLDQLYPGNTALNIPLAVQFSGPLDLDLLERAINAMIDRHEILRTSFAQVDGAPKQVIKSKAHLSVEVIDLESVSAEKRPQRIEQEMIAEAARPLSLNHAPIFRAVLLHLGPKEHVLMLTFHHIVGDGWSNGLVVRELGQFYDALARNKTDQLPPLAFHYADYALWQQAWLKTPQFEKQLDYWKEAMKDDLPVLDMPTDYPRQTGQSYTAFIESLLLPVQLGDALKRLCVELDVTLFMVLYAAYVALLHRYTGQTEFLVGTTAANRNRTELEPLLGLFANPLMLRPEVSGAMTFRELAGRLRDQALNGFMHQEVPFEIILEELQEKMSGTRKPVIRTHFLYQKAFMEPATYGDLVIRPLRSVSPGTIFELTYGIVERAEGIRLQMEFHTALYKNSTIRRLLHHYQQLLEAAVENPDTPISEMTFLTEEERAQADLSTSPQKLAPGEARPPLDPSWILRTLQRRADELFVNADPSQSAVIEPPSGAILVVLDSQLRLLPFGVRGRIYVGGFAPNSEPGLGLVSGPSDASIPIPLLRTDFLGKAREDGKIEVQGQADDFVQVNGFPINLRQIKACLLRHPGVSEAAAVVTSQPLGKNQLVCYIVPKPGLVPTEKELRSSLRGKIGHFIQPAHILTVSVLPKNFGAAIELLPELDASATPIEEEKVPLEAILYQELIEIWMGILGVPGIAIDDNFFALGGSSLLALRMMTQVEKLCRRPLPLSLLLTGATVANLARYIVEANNDSATPLVTVQAKGSRRPLFFLHGDWAGGGFYCGQLSQQLGEDQPFYALTPYHSGKQSVLSMEEMAAYHIAAMKEHTPRGPYLLGGYCIGATVAMEISRQLAEKGDKVTHLLLIDPPLWRTPWLRSVWALIDGIGKSLKWDLKKRIYYFDRYAVSVGRWLKKPPQAKAAALLRRLGLAKTPGATPPAEARVEGDGEILHSLDYAVYFLAYRLYRPKPLTVPATLFFPEETPPERLSVVNRASRIAPSGLTIEMLPGNHHTCITKYTAVLVEKMKKTLDNL
jgi:hypothetical protein